MGKPPKDLSNMLCLDVYLSSLSEQERVKLSHKIKPTEHNLHPLLSGDIYSTYRHQLANEEKRKNDLTVLSQFQKKLNWITDLEEILEQDYFSLILTDRSQKIVWANKAFTAMTGYPVKHALGRSPRFLQGENTSEEVKKRIRQQLAFNRPFTEIITNYRKNKEQYHCKVNIYPIANSQNQITHFLALESETVI